MNETKLKYGIMIFFIFLIISSVAYCTLKPQKEGLTINQKELFNGFANQIVHLDNIDKQMDKIIDVIPNKLSNRF